MPRQSRLDFPGALHHIMARGIEKQKIFIKNEDFSDFLERLRRILLETNTKCFAWTLMNNHFHLLLQSGDSSITKVMRRLLTGYAITFNKRHKRSGHLFQNRYKSILCDDELYLMQLVRYIHLNPVRGNLVKTVKTLNKFKYSGHSVLIGNEENDWQDCDTILSRFGKYPQKAKASYLKFITEGIKDKRSEDLSGGGILRTAGGWKGLAALKREKKSVMGDERILGNSEFVKRALLNANQQHKETVLLNQKKYNLNDIIKKACKYFKIDLVDLKSNSKTSQLRNLRSLICYLASQKLAISGSEIASALNLSRSAVSKLISGYSASKPFKDFCKQYFV
jgi:putative transposase